MRTKCPINKYVLQHSLIQQKTGMSINTEARKITCGSMRGNILGSINKD